MAMTEKASASTSIREKPCTVREATSIPKGFACQVSTRWKTSEKAARIPATQSFFQGILGVSSAMLAALSRTRRAPMFREARIFEMSGKSPGLWVTVSMRVMRLNSRLVMPEMFASFARIRRSSSGQSMPATLKTEVSSVAMASGVMSMAFRASSMTVVEASV